MNKRQKAQPRSAFTLLEVTLCLGFLIVAMVLVAEAAGWGLSERRHSAVRQEAVEQAGPVLHAPEPGLDQCGELGEVVFGQVGQGSFEV